MIAAPRVGPDAVQIRAAAERLRAWRRRRGATCIDTVIRNLKALNAADAALAQALDAM